MKKVILLALTLLIITLSPVTYAQNFESYTENINNIPDFTQFNDQLPYRGGTLCGPTAVSNSIMWLSENGYPLLTNGKNQIEVIKELTSDMNADEFGANVEKLMKGIKTYIEKRGYRIKTFIYHGRKNDQGIRPDLELAKRVLKNNGAVWFNVGWYTYRNEFGQDVYEKNGGHWVTLVGYGNNGTNDDPNYLIIHNPSTRSEINKNDYVELIPLRNALMRGIPGKKYKGLPTNSNGYYKLGANMKINKKKGDTAILEGMVVLELL
ncbi:MAG: C39 family peptidase [Vampirovibrionia bacterium]